jgi:hypothetical protein
MKEEERRIALEWEFPLARQVFNKKCNGPRNGG